ncbi:BOS complex subunit NOMO1-like [Saccostrea echinata]|uniref:BOS complex subunit NOMO1-like n=1 Tax=Saccostrea echinata TaxID=191078 RepID=UPI002A831F86|nr:BOS complex subunit NOMO1-like [Saccostrea echinata]
MFSNMLFCFFLFILQIVNVTSDGVLGCGGFVKSDVDINFSLVEVKLYTTHGSIKYQTDCAPNTGYYLIPLYEKADFILKVEPPKGWSFEPESYSLKVDGETDKCSRGEDINFRFTGFTVSGKVISKGQSDGPEGVTVTLLKTGTTSVLQTTTTGEGGAYSFSKVMPGDYTVQATSTGYKFSQSEAKFTVKRDNVNVPSSVVISGYQVTGRVQSEGEAIKGVNFILFSKQFKKEDISDCKNDIPSSFSHSEPVSPLCYVVSGEDGSFVFPSLPVGDFFIVPFYKGEHIRFDVAPGKLDFHVPHSPFTIPEVFQVKGFSVTGKVLESSKGSGVGGAKVLIDGKQQATTEAGGKYHLENMKTGTYRIQVQKDNVFFDEISVKITPNTPQIQDIIASGFHMCGQVIIDKLPDGVQGSAKRRVIYYPQGKASDAESVLTDSEGKFCSQVKPGKYIVKVHLTDEETKAGLQLVPSEKEITVQNAPVLDIVFSQFRAKLSGSIKCLEKCGGMEVSLSPVSRSDNKQITQAKEGAKGTVFQFENILPGKYKVTLLHDTWCWKDKTLEIEVKNSDVINVDFTQTGYILKCTISHEIILHFEHNKKAGSVGSFNLNKGTNRFCLAQPGVYKLRPDSCHKFEKEEYIYDTGNPELLALTAVSHLVEGSVTAEEKVNDIQIDISSSKDGEVVTLGPLTVKEENKGSFIYKFQHWARSNEKMLFTVKSKELLFSPSSVEVTVVGDTCPGEAVKFVGKRGIFITGSIKPKLAGVTVTVTHKDGSAEPIVIETPESGEFKVGPLHREKEYEVTAEKAGYVLEKEKEKPLVFTASKLGEISVQVVDEKNQPLSDVLLSLSGGKQYRSNNVTRENGTIVFIGLSPGQYYLRPMMKEYKFEPNSQMIDVLEGTTMKISIKGIRIAYSCYGFVTSLNGEAEQGVIVEAVGDKPECNQEESKTEPDGSYRIRGLQPKCTYQIRLKSEVNPHIEKAAPQYQELVVKDSDFTGINIIAFRRNNQMDVSGNVVTEEEFLPHLKVRLYRDDNPDSPIHTSSLGPVSFFYLPSLQMTNEKYLLRLESTLSKAAYEYDLPEISFQTNKSYKHFTFNFTPKRKSLEQELSQSSVLALPLAILIGVAIYNYQKLLPVLSKAVVQIKTLIAASQSEVAPSNGSSEPTTYSASFTEQSKKRSKPRKT